MRRLKLLMKENKLLLDIINVLLGIILIALIILIFMGEPSNNILLTFFILCGLMNITNGLRMYHDSKTKIMPISFILIGIVIIIVGIFFLLL